MKLHQTTSPQREWGIRRLLLPLFVCVLAMVAGQSRAQNHTAEDVRQWRQAAEQGEAWAQYNLALYYENGWAGVTQNSYEAVKWYRKAAEQGFALAQNNLGVCYENGKGVAQNYYEAVRWYRKAAEQGDAGAQHNLGSLYYEGNGVAQDYYEAVKYFRKAAEQEDAEAQFALGICYADGRGVAQDDAETARWFRKAAEQGHAVAQSNLGVCYEKGEGVVQNHYEAVRWYRKAAEQGDAAAQHYLGEQYFEGKGVTQDYYEAVKWWRKAAEQGYAKAQIILGACYFDGTGVTQDYYEAMKWYRKAAEQGNVWGQFYLADCYYKGNGVTQDDAEAVKWFRKAAEQGLAEAQYYLAECYYVGNGVTQNYYEAVKWSRKAAGQGHAEAQSMLGLCYYLGEGVTKNYTEAERWARKAAEQGNYAAKLILDILSGSTSSVPTEEEYTAEEENVDDEAFDDAATSTSTSTTTVVTVSPKGYADFFPVYGVLPGKTTVSDVKALGYVVESDRSSCHAHVQTLIFWGHDGDRVFKDIHMEKYNAMPDKWRELGLDWKLSYDEWLALFQRMDFSIEHTKAPETTEYSGRNTLSAEFVATAPDQTFTMELDFNYGNKYGEGYSTRSKRSLNIISVKLKNKPSVFPANDARALSVASVPAVRRYFSDFFPVYGVAIGRSTISDVEALDYAVEEEKYARVEGLAFWNHNGDQIFEDLYMTNDNPMPEKWQRLGLDWRLSYDDWLALFQKMGFTIVHTRTPRTKHNALSAEFIATAPDGSFTMELDFMYGNKNGEGHRTSSRNSLYTITMETE